jgi:ABC-type lipoprotein release transport system permease subunit
VIISALHSRSRIASSVVLFLAVRGLATRKLANLLLLGAMAAAIGFQIPNEANFRGYRAALIADGVEAGFGAVRVRPVDGQFLTEIESRRAKVAELPGVRAAVPLLALPGAVRKHRAPDNGMIFGVDAERGALPYRLVSGRHLAKGDDTGVLLGVEYAEDVGAALGDEVTVYVLVDIAPQALDEDRVVRRAMTVRGIVSGVFGSHEGAFVDRGFLESQAGLHDQASLLMVYADDTDQTATIAAAVRGAAPDARVTTWYEDSDFLRSAWGSIDALSKVSVAKWRCFRPSASGVPRSSQRSCCRYC